ncbi:MAG: hypothetical protein IJA32_06700 [Lachnospiraceae bacterium]|nr:hypothetical protein [Lachnospiraceae bacterium]
MEKESLIKRAEKRLERIKKDSSSGENIPSSQIEISKMSIAIIKAICKEENTTPNRAIYASKLAIDIIDSAMQFDTIL